MSQEDIIMETCTERYTGKKIALYLLIAFGIAWILQAVAITFFNDYLYTALLAISMLVPMLAALIVNSGAENRKKRDFVVNPIEEK
jgi:high-affinity K+ transport system ATPase subunit B